jgi:signal transduction histidine kinase/ligand-binding sensor domain-containing protein
MIQARKKSGMIPVWAGFIRLAALVMALYAGWRADASGVAGDYLTDLWTADDGLPDSCVTAISQTPDGYLWVGTFNGLARFDGLRFEIFDPSNTPALGHAHICHLYADDNQTLWINTFDSSMTSFRDEIFSPEWKGHGEADPEAALLSSSSNRVNFLLNRGPLRSKPGSAPPGIGWEEMVPTNRAAGAACLEDSEGTIWCRNADKHLSRLAGTNFEMLPPTCGLGAALVNSMVKDSTGRLWVGTDAGIAVWNGTHFRNASPTNSAGPVDVGFLSVAADGGIWAVVDGRLRKAIGRRWVLEVGQLKDVFKGNLSRMGALDDHRGGVWLYDYGKGLWHVAADGKLQMFGSKDGFPTEHARCFFEDREGNLWAGLDTGGLVRLCERRFRTIDQGGDISAKPARSVCEESDGTIWVGTLGDGLERWRDGIFTNVEVPGGMGKESPFCVCPDSGGRLWLSAGSEDLFVRDREGFKQVSPVVHGVKSILTDQAGRIWVGTKSGLFVAEKDLPSLFTLFEGTGQNIVRALAEDGLGNLWAGADDGTLFRIGANDTTTAFHAPQNTASQPASPPIWSLLADKDGTIWIGSYRGGLMRFREGKFTRYGIHEGLPDNIICQILSDDADNLWLGSHQGIFRVAKAALNDFACGEIKTVPVTVFGRSDGLPSLECSGGYQPAAWRAHDGQLWFTTLRGAVSVQPAALRLNLLPPAVVIEEILLDGKSFLSSLKGAEKPALPGATYDRKKGLLELPPGRHHLEFRYTGLSLVSSDRVQFRYRLEGADAGWVEAGTRRSVQYNLLPAGDYRFQVIACNSDRVWNETGASLLLKIPPHFYESLWFRVTAWMVATGLTAGAIWFSVTRRMHRKMEGLARQQAVERERARIAKDIHDDLGANLTLIAVLGGLARQEKAGERIEKMASTARQAVKSLDEIVWAVNPRNDTLGHLIDYLGQYAADYLRAAGVRCRLDVSEPVPEREVSSNLRHNVFLAAKEALQNIVKHAHAGEAWLRIGATNEGLRIAIEDDGCGFEQAPENALADGLRNMRQRMKEINGVCRIESRAGIGTQIILELRWASG